jgi:hypothetical protein
MVQYMATYWVHTTSDDVFEALSAVDQALQSGNQGSAPTSPEIAIAGDADPYLTENVATAHTTWMVDSQAIVQSNRPGLGRAINLFQQIVRRATWWQTLPQWQQVSAFHGALVRVIDVLLDRQRLLGIRISQLESTNMPMHVFALEQQIQALRDEQRTLRRRVAELEQRLHE